MPVRNTGYVFRRVPGSAVRILIGAALLGGSVTAYGFFMSAHPGLWNHSDEYIYWAAGRMVRANPAAVYHVLYGGPREYRLPFTYPPFAAWAFSAVAGVSFNTLQVALVALNISLLPVITFLSMRLAGHRAARSVAAALAIAAISVWLEPVYSTLFFGQINLILLALILADFAIPATCRWKGSLIGIAAGIKLTPLIFVPYLAATRRLRAAAVSLLAFAATVGIGFLTLPAGSREYWTSRVFAGPGGAQNLANQSINGVIQRLVDTPSLASTTWAVLAVLTAAAGIGLAAIACRRGLELAGIVICALTGLLVSPISWTHHWVWVVPGLTLLLAGTRPATAATPGARLHPGSRRAQADARGCGHPRRRRRRDRRTLYQLAPSYRRPRRRLDAQWPAPARSSRQQRRGQLARHPAHHRQRVRPVRLPDAPRHHHLLLRHPADRGHGTQTGTRVPRAGRIRNRQPELRRHTRGFRWGKNGQDSRINDGNPGYVSRDPVGCAPRFDVCVESTNNSYAPRKRRDPAMARTAYHRFSFAQTRSSRAQTARRASRCG